MQTTYNSAHGAGLPGVAGPSHGLNMGDLANGGVAMDVFDQDLNFDESLL